jgi:hypothetical protein
MLAGERVTGVIGVQDSCVHDAGDTSRLRSRNDVHVLRQPLTGRTTRNQQ